MNKVNKEDLDKDKVKEVFKKITDNFPFDKYEKLVEALEKVMTDPAMKKEIKLYLEELNN
tara:strand:- start:170 stop:349 length:180 start_codon:yes stop_codon:yes gene_type:complete